MNKFRGCLIAAVIFLFSATAGWADQIDDWEAATQSAVFDVYYPAFRSLISSQDPKATEALIRILKTSSNSSHREMAIEGLYSLEGRRDPSGIPLILEAMKNDSDRMVRAKAAYALGELKVTSAAGDVLTLLKNDTDSYVRETAAETLGKLAEAGTKDEAAFTELLRLLKEDPTPSVRDSAALGLSGFKDARAVEPLIAALKDPDYLVRAFTASSLGRLGDVRAVVPLQALISDSNETARQYAAEALKTLGASADSLAQGGDLRAALTQYIAELGYSYLNWELRRKIIDLVVKLDPKPVLPEEAQRAMARGKVEFEKVQAIAGWSKPAEEFQKASNLAPWWPDAYYNLALVLEKQMKYSDALENMKLYLYAAPNAPDAPAAQEKVYQLEYRLEQQNKVYDMVQSAADLHNGGNIEAAIPILKDAIQMMPDYYLAHSNLGRAYEQLERHREAIPELEEAIRLGESSLLVYFDLSVCYEVGEENYDKALEVLQKGLQANPYSSEEGSYGPMKASIYRNMGYYNEKKGNYKAAIENYEKAIEAGHTQADAIRQGIENIRPYVNT